MAWTMWSRSGPMELLGFEPFDTFVAGELESKSGGSYYEGPNVDKNVAIDRITCEVEIFVSLNKEGGHQSVTQIIKAIYFH